MRGRTQLAVSTVIVAVLVLLPIKPAGPNSAGTSLFEVSTACAAQGYVCQRMVKKPNKPVCPKKKPPHYCVSGCDLDF